MKLQKYLLSLSLLTLIEPSAYGMLKKSTKVFLLKKLKPVLGVQHTSSVKNRSREEKREEALQAFAYLEFKRNEIAYSGARQDAEKLTDMRSTYYEIVGTMCPCLLEGIKTDPSTSFRFSFPQFRTNEVMHALKSCKGDSCLKKQ